MFVCFFFIASPTTFFYTLHAHVGTTIVFDNCRRNRLSLQCWLIVVWTKMLTRLCFGEICHEQCWHYNVFFSVVGETCWHYHCLLHFKRKMLTLSLFFIFFEENADTSMVFESLWQKMLTLQRFCWFGLGRAGWPGWLAGWLARLAGWLTRLARLAGWLARLA